MVGLCSKDMKTEQQLADELMAQMGVVRSDLKALALLVIAGALVALAGDEVDWVGLVVMGAIVLLLIGLMLAIGLRSIRVRPQGIVIRYPLQKAREFAWEEIDEFRQNPWSRSFIIRASCDI